LRWDGQKSQRKNDRRQRSPIKPDHFLKSPGCGSEQRLVYLPLEVYVRKFACRSPAIGDNRRISMLRAETNQLASSALLPTQTLTENKHFSVLRKNGYVF
jgi:hypothetical protein